MNQRLLSRLQHLGAQPSALERLAAQTTGNWSAGPGASIVAAHEPSIGLHLLEDGWARRSRWLHDGRCQTTALLLAGDICDLDRLALGGCNTHAQAITFCRGVRLPTVALMNLLREEPSLSLALQRLAAADAVIATEWLVSLGRRSAIERIAFLLCEVAVRLECALERAPVTFAFPLTQADVADAMGLSAVHVNRSLQALRDGGVVVDRRRVTLSSFKALAAIAKFDADYLSPMVCPA